MRGSREAVGSALRDLTYVVVLPVAVPMHVALTPLVEKARQALGLPPVAADIFQHYLDGFGREYSLSVPTEWHDYIVGWTRHPPTNEPGARMVQNAHGTTTYLNVNARNETRGELYDLWVSLGHFNVNVSRNPDGSTTYRIEKCYEFGLTDPKGRPSVHGFHVRATPAVIQAIRSMLPAYRFPKPGGFDSFRLKREKNGTYTLYIPWLVLASLGQKFYIRAASRERPRWPHRFRTVEASIGGAGRRREQGEIPCRLAI